jgi:hypothetical protein
MKKSSYTGWGLKGPTGMLGMGVFYTRKLLIKHYTDGPQSEKWAAMKKSGYRAVKVLVTEVKPKIYL